MVSPWPPSTNAVTFSTETFSSSAMKVRKRAESSTPAIPMHALAIKLRLPKGSLRHCVQRIRNDDQDAVRRGRGDLTHYIGHDFVVRLQQIVAAHARLARNAGRDHHDVGVRRIGIVVGADDAGSPSSRSASPPAGRGLFPAGYLPPHRSERHPRVPSLRSSALLSRPRFRHPQLLLSSAYLSFRAFYSEVNRDQPALHIRDHAA